ncbi:hypothetical protein AB0G74_03620 [Streptomyces sp. NPDC020875]|uniref:hypothetical protein n=1 Tax=Streptomyces sp. NPDC020875 TaxID=3154898 RepID=UPI0033CF1D33
MGISDPDSLKRRLVHDGAKTEASVATLPVPEIAVTALRLRQQLQAATRQTIGDLWTVSELRLHHVLRGTGRAAELNRSFAAACARAGVRTIRLHDTRHTCEPLLGALGVHPRVAMQILRHSSKIAVTMKVYTHVPSQETSRALRRLGKHLGALKIRSSCCTLRLAQPKSPWRESPPGALSCLWT